MGCRPVYMEKWLRSGTVPVLSNCAAAPGGVPPLSDCAAAPGNRTKTGGVSPLSYVAELSNAA